MTVVLILSVVFLIFLVVASAVAFTVGKRLGKSESQGKLPLLEQEVGMLHQQLQQKDQAHLALSQQQQEREREYRELAPIANDLAEMKRKLGEMEEQRASQHGQLSEQLQTAVSVSTASKEATIQLREAFKSNTQRGVYGEMQLKRIVEAAGLLNKVDFFEQQSFDGDDGGKRPDLVVQLPNDKYMVVDAKVPFSSYLQAYETEDAEQRKVFLKAHAQSVRGHVNSLSAKNYWDGMPNSPEFTILFIPNDQILTGALEADPDLIEYGFSKAIVLTTPGNLWPVLKTVAYTWKQEALTKDAKKIFDLGDRLYRETAYMSSHAAAMRAGLMKTVESYNKLATSLDTKVFPTAKKLDGLNEGDKIKAIEPIELAPREILVPELEPVKEKLQVPKLDYKAKRIG